MNFRLGPLLAATIILAGLLNGPRAFAADASGDVKAPPPPLEHVRIVWTQNPAETALISWTTPTEGTSHTVYYDTQPRLARLPGYAFQSKGLPSRKYTMPVEAKVPAGWAQNVVLEKLTPATTYYFVVVSDGVISREFHFITAPSDNRPIKFLYGADSRPRSSTATPHLTRREMNRRLAALVEAQPEILALAHGGDYDTAGEWRYLRDWLSDHELTTTQKGRILPIIPTRGNHEGREGRSVFEEVFFLPGRSTPYYFATALSNRAVLLTLNSNASKGGDQRDWLQSELARHRSSDGKWIIVQYHVPAYPSVKTYDNGAQQRLHWVPLFEDFQVDLVCEADDHMLKRTVPIYRDKHDPERGIIYIGDGGLGVPQRVPDSTRWYLKYPGFATPAHHVHLIELGDEKMRVTAIGLEGELLDQFSVAPKAALVPAGAK